MPKTNAQKCKDYYYRKKAAAGIIKVSIKKTGAERTRACRLRKKMLAQGNQSSMNGTLCIPSTSNSQIITCGPSPQPVTTVKMSGENVTQTNETKPDMSSIENISVKQEIDINIEIEDHDPSPQIKTESNLTSNVESLSDEITSDGNLFENVHFCVKQETDTHNNYIENEDTVLFKKETSDIQTDKAIENLELSNTAAVKEERMENDSLVSYDYPDFNDAASMDSNDATALGNVEACLDSTSIKSESEVNYEVNQHLLKEEIDKGNVKIEQDLSVTETHLISNKVINTTSTVTNPQDGVIQSQTTKTLVMEILPMVNGPLSKSGNPEEILPTTYYNYESNEDCNTFQLNSITGDVLSLEQEAYGLLKAKRKRQILDKEYSCPKCPKLFKLKYSIKKHLEVHDSIDRRAMGVLKGLQTKKKNMEKRLQTEPEDMCEDAHVKPEMNKEGYECTCGKVFQRRSRMETCLRSHNLFSDTNTCFSCSTCSKAFKDKNDFQMHRKRLHSKKRFPCKFCPTDYNTRKELFKHLRIHQRVQETEYKVISEVVKGKKKLKCFMCSKSYTNLSELKSHVMDDHKEPYVCRRCKNTFPTIIDFGNHTKTAHPEVEGQSVLDVLEAFAKLVKAWKCEECGLQFHEPDKLALHKAEKHSLVSNIELQSQCKDCKRVFVSMKGLMSHRRVHHSTESTEETETVDKGIMCLECRKMCKDMNALTSHMRFHSPERKYPCKFCDFRFATPEKRKTHAEIHTGDMKYVCFICEYQCSSENRLKIHKMSLKHVNMKEYLLTGKPLLEEQSTSQSEKIKTTLRKKEWSDDTKEKDDDSDSSSSSDAKSEVTCDICGEQFKNEKKMLEHKQIHPFIEFPNDDKPTRIFFK